MSKPATFELARCALASVTSLQMLGSRLSTPLRPVSAAELEAYAVNPGATSGGDSAIIDRGKRLRDVRGRIHDLLSQVTLPSYAQPLRKRLSDVARTPQHAIRRDFVKIGPEPFDPSIRDTAVTDFFEKRLTCSKNVASLLARLLTDSSHLTSGSQASPIIAYFVDQKMYDAVAMFAEDMGFEMTLYVDSSHLSISVCSPETSGGATND